jgi:uncharacterized protein YigE (DUF2233 family)
MGGWGLARQQSLMMWFYYPLLLLMLVGGGELPDAAAVSMWQRPPVARVDLSRPNCESTYDGIIYCVEDGGDIHVVTIDLDNPYIRFEMVMADDVNSVNTDRRERIEDMVSRPPYQEQEVVVAINADYFGHNHGPEGLTVKNGRRLDIGEGWGENPNALWRSSLAISRLNRVSLGRKSSQELTALRAYRERFFNAIGGGPLILNYGVVIPNVVACPLERFPLGACRRTIQTAAGLSEDGRWLYLAVGEGRDIEGFAALLRDYGAFTAVKLDGGGSSQLWYDGQMRHDTERAIGNALFVLYSPVPRHDARVAGPSHFPVVEPGERVEINFEIQNTGFLDWEPDLGYRFKNVQGWPVLGPAYWHLPEPVPAGGSLATSLTVVAPYRPGVYEAEWQLARRAEPIGPRLWFGLVVVPPRGLGRKQPGDGEAGLKEQIEAQLTARRARLGFEQEWPALRREIERAIWREVETELRSAWCDENGRAEISIGAMRWAWWAPLLRALAC